MEKKIIHKELAQGRWFTFSFIEQFANVGSDVERTIQWKKKGNLDYSQQACERALELLDLTIADPKNKNRLKEIVRVRSMFAYHYMGINEYAFTDEYWQRYFLILHMLQLLYGKDNKIHDPTGYKFVRSGSISNILSPDIACLF